MFVRRFQRVINPKTLTSRFMTSVSPDTRPQFLIDEANGFLPRRVIQISFPCIQR